MRIVLTVRRARLILADGFWNCESLTNVKITDTITTLGAHAFSDLPSLETLDIQGTIETIGTCT